MSNELEQKKIAQGTKKNQVEEPKKIPGQKKSFVYYFSIGILILIAVTFVVGPASFGFLTQQQPGDFGAIHGRRIVFQPDSFFEQQIRGIAEQYNQAGIQIDFQVGYQVWRTAFQRTLFHTALLVEAERNNITVSSDLIDQELASSPRFQTNGVFDPQRLRATSQAELLQLRTNLRENMISSMILDDLRIGSSLSDSETQFIANIGQERRKVSYVLFEQSRFPNSEVINYIRNNPNLFRAAELSVITMTNSDELAELVNQISSGATSFSEAAIEFSEDLFAEDGGNRGITLAFELQRDLGSVALVEDLFAAAPGIISQPFDVPGGRVAVFKLNQTPREINIDNPLELSRAREYVLNVEQVLVRDFLRAQAEEFSIASQVQGLTTAAANFNLNLSETNEFAANIGGLDIFPTVRRSDGEQLDNAQFSQEFYRQAFQLGINEVSGPIELNSGFMVLSPIQETQAQEFELNFIAASAVPRAADSWLSQDIERVFLRPEFIEDNFDEAYFRLVFGN